MRGVDIKRPRWSETDADEFMLYDLRDARNAQDVLRHVDYVYALAADMGGIFFITHAHAEIVCHNTLINMNTMEAARRAGVKRLLFSSSACVYPIHRQLDDTAEPLKEEDAYPADPEGAYGWEKLHMEHLCKYYREAGWLDTRVVRFHNVYGSETDWEGGRDKAPAALCRKVAQAKLTGDKQVEVWGDGEQVRSFLYIDDCVEGLLRLMDSDYAEPLNLGRDRGVTINTLVDVIADIAGIEVEKVHIEGPQGVRQRNSNNDRCREVLGWEPKTPIEEGLKDAYAWVEEQVKNALS